MKSTPKLHKKKIKGNRNDQRSSQSWCHIIGLQYLKQKEGGIRLRHYGTLSGVGGNHSSTLLKIRCSVTKEPFHCLMRKLFSLCFLFSKTFFLTPFLIWYQFWHFSPILFFTLFFCLKTFFVFLIFFALFHSDSLWFFLYWKTAVFVLYEWQLLVFLSTLLASLRRNDFPKRKSDAPLHTLSKLYDVPVGFVFPLFWGSVLLYLRSRKDGWCSILEFVLLF